MVFLIVIPARGEQLNAAELPTNPVEDIAESYETIALIDAREQILKDAQACLHEAQELATQLKNKPAPSIFSYIASFVYPAPSIEVMLERINAYINQLELLRETSMVIMRRATDAASFKKDVESTLRQNMAAIGDAAYTDPKKVYVYLLDPLHADNDNAVEVATQKGLALSSAQIRDSIKSELEQVSTSDIRKKLLRQIDFLCRNEVTKQEFDAYLTDTLGLLIIDKKTLEKLMEQYAEIIKLKAELDEQRDNLSKLR